MFLVWYVGDVCIIFGKYVDCNAFCVFLVEQWIQSRIWCLEESVILHECLRNWWCMVGSYDANLCQGV